MDIYPTDNCPICSQELVPKRNANISSFFCLNKCYILQVYTAEHTGSIFNRVTIFDSIFDFNNISYRDSIDHAAIEEKINYWKENERYLMRILEGNKDKSTIIYTSYETREEDNEDDS